MSDCTHLTQTAVATQHDNGTVTLRYPNGRPVEVLISTTLLEQMVDRHNIEVLGLQPVTGPDPVD